VSHTQVKNIDPDLPMSISPKGIAYLKEINPDAKIITDDFSMFPISQKYGIQKAYQMAISAGVDYILVSYDTELGYSIF
ncbi:MAG: glycoside hydrolase family 3 N-terminal domain-containing protein, partial [Flammeovirgaceae bacterium]